MHNSTTERSTVQKFGPAQATIIALIIAIALIHFSRAIANPHITILFTLNGFGYLGLATLLFLPTFQRWQATTRRILIGYTALTLILYFVWGVMKAEWLVIGFLCVICEAVLIGLLWFERPS
jgi:hypothetical protein